MTYVKKYYFIKENVSTREYRIYKYLNNMDLKFLPKLYNYDKENKNLKIQMIHGSNIADLYGEDFEKIPTPIVMQIGSIIRTLYDIGIVYPEITGYNFIEDRKSHVWCNNLQHCFYINHFVNSNFEDEGFIEDKSLHIDFVTRFCNEGKKWNSYFA